MLKKILTITLFILTVQPVWADLNDLRINEFLAGNLDWNEDEAGDFDDWIEIYNPTADSVDLAGCYLSDDASEPLKWRVPENEPEKTFIPAGGYLIVWADGMPEQGTNHANFKLSSAGEQILLSDQSGILIDSVHFGQQFANISYGRYPDAGGNWFFLDTPTPDAPNLAGYNGVTLAPAISPPSLISDMSQQITISSSDPQDVIRYTVDGSDPDENSTLYSSAINIDASSVIRARAFRDQFIPGRIINGCYFLNEELPLPALSLITDPDNLFDPAIGIYANPKEIGREWERPVNVQYFKNDNHEFYEDCGIRIQGSTSVTMPKKSFRLFFRKGYGAERLAYDMFAHSQVQSFENLVLRSGYDDDITTYNGTLLRDPVVNEIWLQEGKLTSLGNFASIYINNDYWGVYNIRESINEYFIMDHTGWLNFDLIRYTKWGIQIKWGDRLDWDALWNFFETADFTQDSVYQKACAMMDMEDFADLQALAQCSQYRSWGWGVFAFKEKSVGAKWRWTIWDMDRALSEINDDLFADYYASESYLWGGLMMKQLLENEKFRQLFINRIADYLNRPFLPDRVISVIDSLADIIEPDMQNEVDRWNSSLSKWQDDVEFLRSFSRQRPDALRQQILTKYTLPATHQFNIELTSVQGKVRVNSLDINESSWQGTYFQDIPVQITAMPNHGYKFIGWSDPQLPQQATLHINLVQDTTLSPLFSVQSADGGLLIITPKRIKYDEYLPLLISARDYRQKIMTAVSDSLTVRSSGVLADSIIYLKRGLGTLTVPLQQNKSFQINAVYQDLSSTPVNIQVAESFPQEMYSATLADGQIIWNAEKDRVITGDLTIPQNTHLIIEAGTRVLLNDKVNILVYGTLEVRGSEDQPVLFTSVDWSKPWGGFEFYGSQSKIHYSFFLNAGGDPTKGWKHMNIQPILFARQESNLDLDHVFILNSPGKALGSENSRFTFKNGVIAFVQHGGEFVYSLFEYDGCYVMNLPNDQAVNDSGYVDYDNDGMHVDYVYGGSDEPSRIKNSVFYHGRDDAIDHHGANLEVVNCWLDDWVHEGLAASSSNYVKVFNTVATNCGQGFEAGNGSPQVFLDHCVAVDNAVGIRFGDSYHSAATGHITATNCITFGNTYNIRNYVKNLGGPYVGGIDISYSMTNDNYDNDPDYNAYPFCITGTPQFDENYYLLPQSEGASMAMAGSNMGRADSIVVNSGSVIINEIMYNTASSMDSEDWIELFNGQGVAQNISGWKLKDDDDNHIFVFPQNTVIPPFWYLVACRDTTAFKSIYPEVKNIIGTFSFGFGKEGDQVRLFSAQDEWVDGLTYGVSSPWPSAANGDGPSLELIKYDGDNSLAGYWAASDIAGGTPGRENSLATAVETEPRFQPVVFELAQNYPNPFNPNTVISYHVETRQCLVSTESSVHVKLEVYNILGQKVKTLVNTRQEAGKHTVRFDATSFASGLYFYRLRAGKHVATRKMILLR